MASVRERRDVSPCRLLLLPLLFLAISATVKAQNNEVRVESAVQEPGFLSDRVHVLFGENKLVTTDFLRKHTRNSGGGDFGDNMIVADFLYDGTHRRIFSRSIQLVDIDDPADIRCGRAPGTYPNGLKSNARLQPYEIVCTMGASGWWNNGLTAYQSAIEFGTYADDPYRGYMCLSTATGVIGVRPGGEIVKADTLVCHVILLPDGRLIVGHQTDPRQRPANSLEVNGNVEIRGNLHITGDLVVDGVIRASDFIKK